MEFRFTPSKLRTAVANVRQTHQKLGAERTSVDPDAIKRILASLMRARDDEIDEWAMRQRPSTLYILSGYLYSDRARTALPRIVNVLRLRWRRGFAPQYWRQMQRFPEHEHMLHAIGQITEGKSWEFALNARNARIVIKCFGSGEFLKALESESLKANKPVLEVVESLQIEADSELGKLLQAAVILRGKAQRILTEPESEIARLLGLLRSGEQVLAAYVNYLSQLAPVRWHQSVLADIVGPDLVDHPQRYERVIEALPPAHASALRKYINVRSLRVAFSDEERYAFWQQFAERMVRPARPIRLRASASPKAWALAFSRFGVIEFTRIGAAYFYHPKDFERIISNPDPREDDLKQYRHTPGYFFRGGDNRLIHSGAWEHKWTPIIWRLIR